MTPTRSSLRLAAACLLACACAFAALPARADVIYNNFGAGDVFTTTGGQTVSGFFSVAVPFTPAADATAISVTVAMKSTNGSMVSLSIRADNNNKPSQSLLVAGSAASVPIAAGDPQVYAGSFAMPVPLTHGVKYWIAATFVSGTELWMPNSTGATGVAGSTSGGIFATGTNGVSPAVRIESATVPPATGACCAGATCSVLASAACTGANTRYVGDNTACNAAGVNNTPCCKADFDQSGAIAVTDIFTFLTAWFAGDPATDIDGGGLAVSDIFAFLSAWFGGC